MSFAELSLNRRKLDLLIVSPGGTATTMLLESARDIGLQTNCPFDRDGFKHLPSIRIAKRVSKKVIYVFDSSTANVVQSLRRRGYLRNQHLKLSRSLFGALYKVCDRRHVEKSLLKNSDKQRREFDRLSYTADVMTLEYDDIWSAAHEIDRFLGLPRDSFLLALPERQSRGQKD